MAVQETLVAVPTPVQQGADFAPGEALPTPGHPERTVTVSSTGGEQHTVQIFSSAHPELGNTVKTYSQQLHTEVYLERGLITAADLNQLGIYVDPYSYRSSHLYVRNGSKVSAARMIHADNEEGGLLSLPTPRNFRIDPEELQSAAEVQRLGDIKANEVVEISGLVARKQHGGPEQSFDSTLALYARMLRDSLEQGHKVWLLNVEKDFLRYLSLIVGKEHIHVLGPEKEYMGPATLPVAINPQRVLQAALEATGPGSDMKRAYLKEVLAGMDGSKIPAGLRQQLRDQDIPVQERSLARRVLTDPRTLAYGAIMAFSASRALPAASVEEFEGSLALLWGIDVATAPTYVWGMLEAFTGKNVARRALGATVALSSFAAPYVYYELSGNNYPAYVSVAIAGFVGLAVVKEAVTHTLQHRKEHKIKEGLAEPTLSSDQVSAGSIVRSAFRRLFGSNRSPSLPAQRTTAQGA